jgi:hypothetical protein
VASAPVFVFSRRAIQRCVDELRYVLSTKQLEGLVQRLNRVGRDRFAASWEACLLYSLSRVGELSYEAQLPSGRKPDVSFTYPGENTIGFIADITAISDEGLHNANPVEDLSRELTKLARTVGLDPNHLRYDVRGRHDGPYGYQRTKLKLPPQAELPAFVNIRVLPFFEDIRDQKMSQHKIAIEDADVSFTISYDVSQRFMGGGYPAYNVALSRKKNPLWTQLVNKASQLKAASSITQMGIIACDAGCSLFHRTGAFGTFTAVDVMQQFFSEHPLASFVLLLRVKDLNSLTMHKRSFRVDPTFYSPRKDSDSSRVRTTLTDAVTRLPKPVLDSLNAYIQCRETGYRRGHFGGYQLTGKSVKISARTVLELLAGRTTASEFNEAHGWRSNPGQRRETVNPFERCIQEGRMITRIGVEANENDCDDWLTIEFGEPDPAISPFVIKPKSRR